MFDCPGCKELHGVRVAQTGEKGPVWEWNGSLSRPTLTPSLLVRGTRPTPEGLAMMERGDPLPAGVDRYPCRDFVCHSFVRDGRIQFLSDCTHELRGQTVELVRAEP